MKLYELEVGGLTYSVGFKAGKYDKTHTKVDVYLGDNYAGELTQFVKEIKDTKVVFIPADTNSKVRDLFIENFAEKSDEGFLAEEMPGGGYKVKLKGRKKEKV